MGGQTLGIPWAHYLFRKELISGNHSDVLLGTYYRHGEIPLWILRTKKCKQCKLMRHRKMPWIICSLRRVKYARFPAPRAPEPCQIEGKSPNLIPIALTPQCPSDLSSCPVHPFSPPAPTLAFSAEMPRTLTPLPSSGPCFCPSWTLPTRLISVLFIWECLNCSSNFKDNFNIEVFIDNFFFQHAEDSIPTAFWSSRFLTNSQGEVKTGRHKV